MMLYRGPVVLGGGCRIKKAGEVELKIDLLIVLDEMWSHPACMSVKCWQVHYTGGQHYIIVHPGSEGGCICNF
jgi:hypothetical protein